MPLISEIAGSRRHRELAHWSGVDAARKASVTTLDDRISGSTMPSGAYGPYTALNGIA